MEDSRGDKVNFDCVTYNTGMIIDASELMDIINALSCNKSPGLDGLTSEHIKFADSQHVVLYLLYCLSLYRLSKIRIDVYMKRAITGQYASRIYVPR